MKTKKLVSLSFFLAVAVLLNLIEPSMPVGVPGVKLGLANIAGLICLFLYGKKELLTVNILRVVLACLIKGNLFSVSFFISLSGVLLSSLMLIILKRSSLSIIGLSISSAFFHSLGQIVCVCVIYHSIFILSYLPLMWLLGIISGLLSGVIAKILVERLRGIIQ